MNIQHNNTFLSFHFTIDVELSVKQLIMSNVCVRVIKKRATVIIVRYHCSKLHVSVRPIECQRHDRESNFYNRMDLAIAHLLTLHIHLLVLENMLKIRQNIRIIIINNNNNQNNILGASASRFDFFGFFVGFSVVVG
jgi:hypothetical protein